jgi:transposase InsO family protein
MARLVVTAVVVEGRSKSEVARDYRVSRRWVQRLVARYQTEGEVAFEPRSRRPNTSPQRVSETLEDQIVELRKQLLELGLDAGAVTIAFHLRRSSVEPPAVSTIWRVLSRRGFVTAQPHKRPRSSYVRFEADQPNERWQADTTHWSLTDGTDVEILNIIDDHSRLAIASVACSVFKAVDVLAAFTDAASIYGLPASMLTDNGAVFTANYRGRGWVALERELITLGVRLHHSRPYHPQTCGKVERLHQTEKRWLDRHPADTIDQLQAHLDEFRRIYNTERPHRALGRRTPQTVYDSRPKAAPTKPGPNIATHYRVRRDRIDTNGTITVRYASRLHHIGLGRTHAGTRVLVLAHERDIRVLTENGELLRQLQLDPTHDYQPQPRP